MTTESQELELQVNGFYRDHYRRTMKRLSFLVILALILASVFAWMNYAQPQPAYYAAMTSGDVIPMHALSEPVVTSDFILQWSALTTRLIYNLNFSTYQTQLNKVKARFTPEGWEKMMDALNASLIPQLVGSKLIISSVVAGPPVILARMVIYGRFTWRVQMKLLVTYTSANVATKRVLLVTMNIQRVPTLNAAQGIQIIDFNSASTSE